jgi:spoIIIJ-associated protein
MKSVETSGKTRRDAVQAALAKLKAELHEVKVEVLDEGSRGFFGLGARDVRVRVSLEGVDDEPTDARGNDAAALLEEIIRRMGIRATVSTDTLEDGSIRLNVDTPDSAILIGRKGKTLASLQYLINRMVNTGEDPDKVERIIVDTEGYLDRRRDSLEELARRLAQRAKETGKRVRLKPLDPQERRIIHLALQDNPDVETYSVGNAQIRSVVIQPKGMAQIQDVPEDDEAPSRSERGGRRGGHGGERRDREAGQGRGRGQGGRREAGGREGGREHRNREGGGREGGRRGGGQRERAGAAQGGRAGESGNGPRRERPERAPQAGGAAEGEEGGSRRRRRRGGRRGGRGGEHGERSQQPGGLPSGMNARSSALMGGPRETVRERPPRSEATSPSSNETQTN